MKHLQKVKNVYVKIFSAKNGHYKGTYQFNCALDAKKYVKNAKATSKIDLRFMIYDDFNDLYDGDGSDI